VLCEHNYKLNCINVFDKNLRNVTCFRSADDCNKKQPSDCDTLEYRNGSEGKKCKSNHFILYLHNRKGKFQLLSVDRVHQSIYRFAVNNIL